MVKSEGYHEWNEYVVERANERQRITDARECECMFCEMRGENARSMSIGQKI